jgi:hypothetical protein
MPIRTTKANVGAGVLARAPDSSCKECPTTR